jgi:hypothetical protein
VRKLAKAERAARDEVPQADSEQRARQPYTGRKRAFSPDDASNPGAGNYDVLDVTTFAGHSAREAQPRSRWLMFGDIALASAIEEQRAREGKTTSADFDKLRTRLNNHCIKSLQVDLELGLTMAQIAARASRGSEKRERYTLNARKAYLAILRLRGKVVTTPQQSEQLSQKLKQLRMALLDLGERVQSLPMAA